MAQAYKHSSKSKVQVTQENPFMNLSSEKKISLRQRIKYDKYLLVIPQETKMQENVFI